MDSGYGDDLSKEADTAMYEDQNDDRFEAALRMAEDDPARGAEALRSIVADNAFDPDTRFEAAANEVDEARAAEALRSIVADDVFDPDTRSEAAQTGRSRRGPGRRGLAQHRGRQRVRPRHPLRSSGKTGRNRGLTTKVDHNGIRPQSIEPDGGKPNPQVNDSNRHRAGSLQAKGAPALRCQRDLDGRSALAIEVVQH